MIIRFPLAALVLTLASLAVAQAPALEAAPIPEGAPPAMAAIDRADLAAHAHFLAAEELGGRYTGTPGQLEAARYIAACFESLGLEPLGDRAADGARDWFQRYAVRRTHLDPQRTGVRLGDEEHADGFAVMPARRGGAVDVDGELVFCGRGRRDDLPESFEAGQIPVVFVRGNPQRDRVPSDLQFMMGFREIVKVGAIARRAAAAGAATLLVLDLDGALADVMQYGGVLPGKPQLAYGNEVGMGQLLGGLGGEDVPLVVVGRPLAERVLARLRLSIDDDGAVAQSGLPEDARARVRVAVVREAEHECWNVVAALRGADPTLAGEAVVFSAHMDHMGTRLDGAVFHGADDNASGTAGLLEIAQAFARGERPRRSVIFLSVSGEELGLWGSAHFADHPTWPREDLVADVNIDMIGRATPLSDADQISVTPSYRHRSYSSIGRDAAALAGTLGLGLTIGDQFYERSDHYNFAKLGIPVVFFCDGEHEDYHRVTDTPDKLDYQKIERVARLAYWAGWQVCQADERPETVGRQDDWVVAEPVGAGAGK